MDKRMYKLGIDVGSTTLKMVVMDTDGSIVCRLYTRHKADINKVFVSELETVQSQFPDSSFAVKITGSAGMGIAERTQIPFAQEVVSSVEVIKRLYPRTKTLIDLGGEDSKIVFFEDGKQPDIRMNGSCAGGTGAFIDQMADLMNITVDELGKLAAAGKKIYLVASRCGVFAKTDIQNLISRNVNSADVALSILNAVALQCITTLARGHEIQPQILCIGGPLTFIPALRKAFADILQLSENEMILPENSEYFPALGCAMLDSNTQIDLQQIIDSVKVKNAARTDALPPLFHSQKEYEHLESNRKIKHLKRAASPQNSETAHTSCPSERAGNGLFLGIDSGSTTTKILILDENENIVFTFYAPNQGNPLKKVAEGLEQCREKELPFLYENIRASCSTGYGEELIKSALNLNYGIVETVAHFAGAQYIDPEVSFILDIGGQDMKSIFVQGGAISRIELNEACSSGCGSFLQNFAATMNLSLAEFTEMACLAQFPADLGTRCTVYMNSKVKQSLRENATVGDIAAGLAYSVVKNCLFKVLRINNLNMLGSNIVVQGGTFRNDAVYRALELLSGKTVSSTDMPEMMGALGAALYAKKMSETKLYSEAETGQTMNRIDLQNIETKELNCGGCTNKCTVLRFKFPNGNTSYAGNKCEKIFFSAHAGKTKGYNAFEAKNSALFSVNPANQRSPYAKIGIPRVLNMYENFPFWKTLFEGCGFEVVLSPESDSKLYASGVGSVMSDNICFPAKLAHGHIVSLIEARVDRIFYPHIIKEEKEFTDTNNSFNCPVVSGYPDVIRSAIDPQANYGIPFDTPVINFANEKALKQQCWEYMEPLISDRQSGCFANLSPKEQKKEFDAIFETANCTRKNWNTEFIKNQQNILRQCIENGELCFVVAGRPYHADPLVNQKAGQILSDLGVHVLTDDIFRYPESAVFAKLNLVSQWSYPNRVVQAAIEVSKLPQNIQLVQLNSFGCGPDSFFMDETGEILRHAGKNHTVLRIDEIASPGSVRLRCRSLIESLQTKNYAK